MKRKERATNRCCGTCGHVSEEPLCYAYFGDGRVTEVTSIFICRKWIPKNSINPRIEGMRRIG